MNGIVNAACGNGNPDHASANLVIDSPLSFLDGKNVETRANRMNKIQSYALT